MKKLLLFVFMMFGILTMYAQQKLKDHFTLKGKVVNQKEGYVYLSYTGKDGKAVRDSSALKNGDFQFKGFINEPTIAFFNGQVASRSMDDPNSTNFFIEPSNLQITVKTNDFKNAKITGSRTQSEYEELQKPKRIIQERWKVVMDTLSAANKRSNFEYQELRSWVLRPYFAEMQEIDLAFFNKHPASFVTAYMLRIRGRDLTTDSLKMFYARFPDKVKQSMYGKAVFNDIEKRKMGVVGSVANDFTTTDINNNKLNLSDFKGKYVLLDFWGSWCLPCRKLNPHLKELYGKYKEKGFEVIGVSDDDRNHDAWRKAVAEDGLPWRHVLRGMKIVNGVPDRSTDINVGFNVSSYPTHILIDPAGKIIARYGDGEEAHEMLDSKLKTVFNF